MGLAGLMGCGTSPTGLGDSTGFRLGAFASDRNQSPGQYVIYLWDYDAAAFKSTPNLNSTAAERHPSISSDGSLIAFQVDRGSGTLDDIEVYERIGHTLIQPSALATAAPETEPAFTGDGLKLCFVQGSASRRIRMYDSQTKQLVALPGLDTTGAAYSDYSPAPNRDGSLIAFVSDRSGSPHVYIYSRARAALLDGPRLRQALVSDGVDVDPSFTSSGRFLAFSSTRATGQGGYDIYLLEFAQTQSLTDTLLRDVSTANSTGDDRHPAVSDDGNVLVFQSRNRANGLGGWDLWNFKRGSAAAGRSEADSPGDDIEPSLKWPY